MREIKTRHDLVLNMLINVSVYSLFSAFFAFVFYASIGTFQKLAIGQVDISLTFAWNSGLVCTLVYLLTILASKDRNLSKD